MMQCANVTEFTVQLSRGWDIGNGPEPIFVSGASIEELRPG